MQFKSQSIRKPVSLLNLDSHYVVAYGVCTIMCFSLFVPDLPYFVGFLYLLLILLVSPQFINFYLCSPLVTRISRTNKQTTEKLPYPVVVIHLLVSCSVRLPSRQHNLDIVAPWISLKLIN